MSPENNTLQRGLKTRHMTMIAIGGAIGTGLFVASGAAISTAGPLGALVAYTTIGIMVYFLMTSLGELATYMPVSGSFATYATKYVDPALGFALGWNYWYNWAITLAVEMVAAGIVVKFWIPDASTIVVSFVCLAILIGLNAFSVKMYGESEFWFAGIKVVAIVIFLFVGVLMIFGFMGGEAPGFANWTIADAPFNGGFMAILGVFMIAGFSFQGTELVGIAAGECENPQKNVPKAIKTVFWRIMLFYIGAMIIIGFLLPYNDPNLLKGGIDNIAVSPFTLIFQRAGFAFAASAMNAVILTSLLSCANSGLYASTRILYAMALDGKAPKIFGKINKRGVPMNALIATSLVGAMCFITSPNGSGTVYIWLMNATGLAGFIAWLGIALSHYRFRKAFAAQGRDMKELTYKAKWFPFGPIFALVLCIIVIVGQNWIAFTANPIDWYGITVSYIGLPLFLALYFGFKIVKKTKIIPLKECEFKKVIVDPNSKVGNAL